MRGSEIYCFFLVLFGTRKQGAVYGEILEKCGDGAMYVKV